jgi:hypothetical protein
VVINQFIANMFHAEALLGGVASSCIVGAIAVVSVGEDGRFVQLTDRKSLKCYVHQKATSWVQGQAHNSQSE